MVKITIIFHINYFINKPVITFYLYYKLGDEGILENLQFKHINERNRIISIRSKDTLEDYLTFLFHSKEVSPERESDFTKPHNKLE